MTNMKKFAGYSICKWTLWVDQWSIYI